jgi:O-antigen ligase
MVTLRFLPTISMYLLPIYPPVPIVVLVCVGVIALWRGKHSKFGPSFLLFAVFGALSQLFGPNSQMLESNINDSQVTIGITNLIHPASMNGFHAWNAQDGEFPSMALGDGFYRILQRHPSSQREFTEFLTTRNYPLKVGYDYTQSFYVRHDGSTLGIIISFVTAQGHHLVETHVQNIARNLVRVYGTYRVQSGDTAVRAIDFINAGGDWTYLEVGKSQLELGSAVSPYSPGPLGLIPLWQRTCWWLLMALGGYLFFLGVRLSFSDNAVQFEERAIRSALAIGLCLHLGIVLLQLIMFGAGDGRASGWLGHPNLLGQVAVSIVGIIWVLNGSRTLFVGLAVAISLVWFSGSRSSLLGFLPIFAAIILQFRHRVHWVFAAALVVFSICSVLLGWTPGRFSTLFDLNSVTDQTRLQIWQVALTAFLMFPWTGIGWGHFPVFYELHPPPNTVEFGISHTHNFLLQLLSEAGVLGLLGYLVLLGKLILNAWRQRAFRILVFYALVLTMNMFDYTIDNLGIFGSIIFVSAWLEGEDNQQFSRY